MIVQKLDNGMVRVKGNAKMYDSVITLLKDAKTKVATGNFSVTDKKKWEIFKETSPTSKDLYVFSIIDGNGKRYTSHRGSLTLEQAKDLLSKHVKREYGVSI